MLKRYIEDFRFWRVKREVLASVRRNVIRQDTYNAYRHTSAVLETKYSHLNSEQRQEIINYIMDKIL